MNDLVSFVNRLASHRIRRPARWFDYDGGVHPTLKYEAEVQGWYSLSLTGKVALADTLPMLAEYMHNLTIGGVEHGQYCLTCGCFFDKSARRFPCLMAVAS